jgi:hypothetical protein
LQNDDPRPIFSDVLLGFAVFMLIFGWSAWARWSSVRRAKQTGEISTGFGRGSGRTVFRSIEPEEFQAMVRGRIMGAIVYGLCAVLTVAGMVQAWLTGYPI